MGQSSNINQKDKIINILFFLLHFVRFIFQGFIHSIELEMK